MSLGHWKHWRGEDGFDLIELMIVMAIVGIMAAIAIPMFAQAIGKANCRQHPDSQQCYQFKANEQRRSQHRDDSDDVHLMHVVNDTQIEYQGHIYRRED